MAYNYSLYVDTSTLSLRTDPRGGHARVDRLPLVQGTKASVLLTFLERVGANTFTPRSFGSPLEGTMRLTLKKYQATDAINSGATTWTATTEPLTRAVAYEGAINLCTQAALDVLGTDNEIPCQLQITWASADAPTLPTALLSVPVVLRRSLDPFSSAPTALTRAEQLALPADTAAGQRVNVTDSFSLDGLSVAIASGGLYYPVGTYNGRPWYTNANNPADAPGSDTNGAYSVYWAGAEWTIYQAGNDDVATGLEDTAYPWQSAWTDIGYGTAVLTNPPLQEYAPTIAGMVVTEAGTASANNTYSARGTKDGKPYYTRIGLEDSSTSDCIVWKTSVSRWLVVSNDVDNPLYFSTEDVATPDLVTTWEENAGASPAPAVARRDTAVPDNWITI